MSSRLMPPKAGASAHDGVDELVRVGHVEADRDGVHPPEVLEEHRLALHHRQGGGGTDVTEAEDRGAVGDDGDGARLPGVVVDQVGLLGDRGADPRDPGRVGHRQVVARLERHGQLDADLAVAVQGEDRVSVSAGQPVLPEQVAWGAPRTASIMAQRACAASPAAGPHERPP